MTQEPQEPPVDPQQGPPSPPPATPPGGQPAPGPVPGQVPGQQPPAQPQWGQYAPQPGQPPQQPGQPQWGQYAQQPPLAGQPQQPQQQQPQWGQYAPQPGQPPQAQQPQWGQYAQQPPPAGQPQQPQWGQYAPQPPQPGQPGQPQWGQYPPHPGAQQGYQQPGYGQYVAPPKPGVIPLRPLRLGEVLDGAFQAARRNGKAMFGSALIFQLITAVISLAVTLSAFGVLNSTLIGNSFSETAPSEAELNNLLGTGLKSLAALVGVSFLSALVGMVLQGAMVVPVLRAVLNLKTGFGQMWQLVKPRIGALLVLALLYAAASLVVAAVYSGILIGLVYAVGLAGSNSNAFAVLGLGLILSLPFLAAAVWISIKLLLAPAAMVGEGLGIFAAIKRSWQLTAGNWWRTFGITALAAIIASVISGIISTPVALLMGLLMPLMLQNPTPEQLTNFTMVTQIISTIIGALVGAVTLAFQTGVMALIYVDLRMRRDGFDVTLLKEAESGKDDGGIPGRGAAVPAAVGGTPEVRYPPEQYPPAPQSPYNGQ
ncbi:MAG: glycerophosphoryl diester phosphodiesterase membrane domain-containing protein [Specibacter sp.]